MLILSSLFMSKIWVCWWIYMRSLPVLCAPQKSMRRCFCKKIWKNKKEILLALMQWQTTASVTDKITPDRIRIPNPGTQPTSGSSAASGYTAKPPTFGISNGLTVYNYTLDEKEEYQKGSDEALERLRTHDLRVRQHRDSNRLRPTSGPRWNRYASNGLVAGWYKAYKI